MNASIKKPGLKIAFLFDDRLPRDRKANFTRMMSVLKSKYPIELLPKNITEDELLAHLEHNSYSAILLPWYKYFQWKKIENSFGSLRLEGPALAGYFADAILPFEFPSLSNYHRTLLLDFYRFDLNEIEVFFQTLLMEERQSGLSGFNTNNAILYHGKWTGEKVDEENADGEGSLSHPSGTRCIDLALKIPILQNPTWSARSIALRFYLTALWTLCFQQKHSFSGSSPNAEIEIGEFHHCLVVRFLFESSEMTLKTMMDFIWPNGTNENISVNELTSHADFLRVYHFPESHHIEITAFFIPGAPSAKYRGEVRGFWIEPLKKRFMNASNDLFIKRVEIGQVAFFKKKVA